VSENGIEQAEKRVREMNMAARQFNEQGNRFMRQALQAQQIQQSRQTRQTQQAQYAQPSPPPQPRFETVGNKPPAPPLQSRQNERPAQNTDTERQQSTYNGSKETMDTGQFIPGFDLNGEKLMILLIMYLLIKEKADIKLILAMGYLLL